MNRKIEWEEKIESYLQSKKSLNAWCKTQGISASTVRYHLKKLHELLPQNWVKQP